MLARDLISDVIPPLKTSDSVARALSWMSEFKVSHLPIVNNLDFLGLISEDDIIDLNEPEQPIGYHELRHQSPYVYEFAHLYEVLKLIAEQQITIVPVLNSNNHYLGLITMPGLITKFSEMASVATTGGIIVLEMGVRDFSLSEIVRIIEENDTRVISTIINSPPDSTRLELTIKTNVSDVSAIIKSLERFGYDIKASHNTNNSGEDSVERFDEFMRYLNM